MKRWIVGGLAVTCAGVGVGLWLARTDAHDPANRPEPPPVAVAPPATIPAPVVLADVVDVADLNPLLDPPAKDASGAPFDADSPATVLLSTPVVPDRIPPAVD